MNEHSRPISIFAALILCIAGSGLFAREDADEPLYTPGLLQCFSPADKAKGADCRIARLVALHSPAGNTPSPFLDAEPLEVEWHGFLDIDLADDFTFTIEGRGRFTLTLAGKKIIDSAGEDLSKEKPVTVELENGKIPLLATYSAPAAGAAELRLFWSSFDWQREPVPPMVLFHDPSDKAARESRSLRQGRELFARLRCVRCHSGIRSSETSMPELSIDAPSLLAAGKKFRPDWLARWIEDPRGIRKQATMPRLLHGAESRENARDIAAWLSSLGKPGKVKPTVSPEVIKKGGELFADLGCFNCHTLRKAPAAGEEEADRISLRNIGDKWRPRALEEFLLDPDRDYKWIRMGDLGLKAAEARALVAFLLSRPGDPLKTQTFKRPPNPTRGREVAEKLRCANCHQLAEEKKQEGLLYPATNDIAALTKNGFKGGCLSASPPGRHGIADFGLEKEQLASLRNFATSRLDSLERSSPAEFAGRQLRRLRCGACHDRDSKAALWPTLEEEVAHLIEKRAEPEGEPGSPEAKFSVVQARPPLTWTGEKLRAEWTAKQLAGTLDYELRPWLRSRMPRFPARARGIADGLARQHGYPAASPPLTKSDSEMARVGKKLALRDGGFSCVSCHGVGKKPPEAVFEVPGTNFMYASERLRREHFHRWMLDPSRVVKNSRMPQFADDEARSPFVKYYGGDARRQFEAIWQWFLEGRDITPPVK